MNSNSNNNDSGGTDMREEALSDLAYSVGFSFAVLFVLVLVSYLSYRCNSNNNTSTQAPNYTTTNIDTTPIDTTAIFKPGLTEATLGTYPKFMYSQFKAQKGSDSIGSGCSICLVDYKDTDMIRALPECGHLYHLKCIDPWLKLHPSCPICRSSPTPTPLAEVVVPLAS